MIPKSVNLVDSPGNLLASAMSKLTIMEGQVRTYQLFIIRQVLPRRVTRLFLGAKYFSVSSLFSFELEYGTPRWELKVVGDNTLNLTFGHVIFVSIIPIF